MNFKQLKQNKKLNSGKKLLKSRNTIDMHPGKLSLSYKPSRISACLRPTMMPATSKRRVPMSRFDGIKRSETNFSEMNIMNYKNMKSIPCLALRPPLGSDKLILYFHANAEDIKLAQPLCTYIQETLNVI